jgi:drug/metabolite transporter (DMT)-like permease
LKKSLPYLALVAGVLALSLSTLYIRWATAPGIVTSLYRMVVATLAVAPFFWRQRAIKSRTQDRPPPTRRAYGPALLAGVLSAFDHATVCTAVQWTAVANATLLNNLAPVWVALFAVLVLRQRLGRRFWVGLTLACVGAVVVLGNSGLQNAPHQVRGDALSLLSSLFYAAYFLSGERARRQLDTLEYVWPMTATAAGVLLVGTLALGYPLAGYSPLTYAVFVAAGLISQVGGYFAVGYALGHLPAAVVSATLIAQPVVTALLAIPFAGEGLGAWQVLGGVGVLAGIWLVVRPGDRPARVLKP